MNSEFFKIKHPQRRVPSEARDVAAAEKNWYSLRKMKDQLKVGVSKYTKVPIEKRDQFWKMAFHVLILMSLYLLFYGQITIIWERQIFKFPIPDFYGLK